MSGLTKVAQAQSCPPASVSYLVRDEKGRLLSETDLQSISNQLPEWIGDAHVYLNKVSFASDGETFYFPESDEAKRGKKKHALAFGYVRTCTMHLTEATLTYHNKKMRLIFNIEIARGQRGRMQVVDSIPFQEGTFQLDLSGWSADLDKVIPATRWKKI